MLSGPKRSSQKRLPAKPMSWKLWLVRRQKVHLKQYRFAIHVLLSSGKPFLTVHKDRPKGRRTTGLPPSVAALLVVFVPLLCRSTPVITNLHQLKPLTRAQAGSGLPLQIKGTVVCYDAGWHQLYLHDGVETLYFNADDFSAQPQPGDVVTVSGTALGDASYTNMSPGCGWAEKSSA